MFQPPEFPGLWMIILNSLPALKYFVKCMYSLSWIKNLALDIRFNYWLRKSVIDLCQRLRVENKWVIVAWIELPRAQHMPQKWCAQATNGMSNIFVILTFVVAIYGQYCNVVNSISWGYWWIEAYFAVYMHSHAKWKISAGVCSLFI